MSRALEAIETLRVSLPPARLAHRLPEPGRLALARAARGLDADAPSDATGDVLQRLAAELRALFDPVSGSRKPTPKQLRLAPWVLWSRDLAGLPGLLDAVLARARERPPLLVGLIRAWLRDADPSRPETRAVGRRLGELLADGTDARLAPWLHAHRRFALFDPALGPQAVTRALLGSDREVAAVLDEAGLGDALVRGGTYVRAVLLAALDRLGAALGRPGAVATWQRLEKLWAPDGTLRFGDLELKGRLADAALSPWVAGNSPDPALRPAIQRFLLRHLGDPRVKEHAWQCARPETVALLRRWLAGDTLEAFFAVIDRHADPHWRYRRAFWLAALRRGAVSDAWLALGSNVAISAKRALKDAAFARLQGGNGNKAALLMRIGDYVLAEWSHSGKLRAWPAGAASAPRPFRPGYAPDELMTRSLAFPGTSSDEGLVHSGAEQGLWQRRAAQFIAERTGITLQPADWALR